MYIFNTVNRSSRNFDVISEFCRGTQGEGVKQELSFFFAIVQFQSILLTKITLLRLSRCTGFSEIYHKDTLIFEEGHRLL